MGDRLLKKASALCCVLGRYVERDGLWSMSDAKNSLVIAQTEQDVKAIQSGQKIVDANHQLTKLHEQASPLAIVHRNRIAQEIRSEGNVSKALLGAEAELENDPQTPPDRTVDEDWLFRWRDAASVVSSEELQTLWGRVLAGEIKSPGSFSVGAHVKVKKSGRVSSRRCAVSGLFGVLDQQEDDGLWALCETALRADLQARVGASCASTRAAASIAPAVVSPRSFG